MPPVLVLAVATASLFWFNRDASWDNWAHIYFFGSYGWVPLPGGPLNAQTDVGLAGRHADRVAVAALILDFRLRIMLALIVALLLGFGVARPARKWPDARPLAFLGQISSFAFPVHFPVLLLANTCTPRADYDLAAYPRWSAWAWRGLPALARPPFYRWIE